MPPRPGSRRPQPPGAAVANAWTGADRLLQQLSSPSSTLRDWAEAAMGVQALQAVMDAVPPSSWPKWLMQRLSATVARGLHPAILGMSGQQKETAVLLGEGRAAGGQAVMVLNALCGVGELMGALSQSLHALRCVETPQFAAPEAEIFKVFTTKTGLMQAIGAAAGHMAAFLQQYKILKRQACGDQSKEAVTYCLTGVACAVLNIWVHIRCLTHGTGMLSNGPAVVVQTVQPVITLSVTLLQAYPGPTTMPKLPQNHSAAAAAAAMTARAVLDRTAAGSSSSSNTTRAVGSSAGTLETSVQTAAAVAAAAGEAGRTPEGIPAEELCANFAYRTQGLPQVLQIARMITDAIAEEVWSRGVGSPGATLLPDTPSAIMQLLEHQDTKYLMCFAVLVLTTHLHTARSGSACLDTSAFPTSSRSKKARRQQEQARSRHEQRQHTPPQQQQQPQQQEPEVEPWHKQLAATMGLKGCAEQLQERETSHEDSSLHALVAVMCCLGASLAGRGEASVGPSAGRTMSAVSRAEVLQKGFAQPMMLCVSELVMMEDDLPLVLFALHLLQALMSTDIPNESWLGPFVASLAPYVVQAVRTADSSDGWRALDGTGFDAEHIRGSLLESACNMVIATVTLTLDAEGVTVFADLIAKQPTVMLSTLDALLRARAEAELTDRVFTRKLEMTPTPPGIKLPEMLRIMHDVLPCSIAKIPAGDPQPTPTAEVILQNPTSTGAAWVGFLVSAQKYALRALQQAPALCAWDVAATAVFQLLGLHVVAATAAEIPLIAMSAAQLSHLWPVIWTAATDAEHMVAADSEDSEEEEEEDDIQPGTGLELVVPDGPSAQELSCELALALGPLLLPVVQLYARALLLLTKALLLPPSTLGLGVLALHPATQRWLNHSRGQFKADAVIAVCFLATQFLELLLARLPQQQLPGPSPAGAAAGAAAASSGSTSSRSQPAAALPADVCATLQQQAAACSSALRVVKEDLGRKAKAPKRADRMPCDELLQAAQRAFSSSSNNTGQGASSSGSSSGTSLLLQLQQLAVGVLDQLPAQKMCSNPNCTQMGTLSEKELSEKRCGACKTAYCSKECSRQHWKQHKPLCKRLVEAAASAAPAGAGDGAAASAGGKAAAP